MKQSKSFLKSIVAKAATIGAMTLPATGGCGGDGTEHRTVTSDHDASLPPPLTPIFEVECHYSGSIDENGCSLFNKYCEEADRMVYKTQLDGLGNPWTDIILLRNEEDTQKRCPFTPFDNACVVDRYPVAECTVVVNNACVPVVNDVYRRFDGNGNCLRSGI